MCRTTLDSYTLGVFDTVRIVTGNDSGCHSISTTLSTASKANGIAPSCISCCVPSRTPSELFPPAGKERSPLCLCQACCAGVSCLEFPINFAIYFAPALSTSGAIPLAYGHLSTSCMAYTTTADSRDHPFRLWSAAGYGRASCP